MRKVTIAGVTYPCLLTLGAMKRFKEETGKELSEIETAGESERIDLVMALVFCCIQSACKREKIDIPFHSVDDMLDYIEPTEVEGVVSVLAEASLEEKKPATKKKVPGSMK